MAASRSLEDKVQQLTESLSQRHRPMKSCSHQIEQLNDKIDRMQKDFAYRLCTLSAQQLGAGDADRTAPMAARLRLRPSRSQCGG